MAGILTRKGINVQRRLFSGQTNYDDEITDLNTTTELRPFLRAVVVDVIFDPNVVPAQLRSSVEADLIHSELLATAPRNSIIARIISGAADKRNSTLTIFYPAMSHTHFPLKPGEQVWVFFENPASQDYGYWLSRIVEPVDIDDPNFTHADRKFIDQRQPTTIERLEETKQFANLDPETQSRLKTAAGKGPQFPNGGDNQESFSLATIDAYEKIEIDAIANKIITKEPVPRYNKRPSDWAAEGSNNSLLVLGEDRTGAAAKVTGGKVDSKPSKDKLAGSAGMFDLVTGRGIGKDRKFPAPGVTPQRTAPPVVKNAREKLETDKEIFKVNQNEGDPDFEFDATRLYGSMDTDVDGNFGKILPKLPGRKDPEKIDKGPAIIAKSNHVRVIAREDGSIRIIKEGTLDDEGGKGHAGFIIEKDGTIVIDGPHIVIGSGIQKGNGEGTQVYIGLDASEPIVLGNILKTLLTEYTSDIKQNITDFCTQLSVFLAPLGATVGNLGLPIPGLSTPGAPEAITFKTNGSDKLKSDFAASTQKFQSKIDTILSKVGKTK